MKKFKQYFQNAASITSAQQMWDLVIKDRIDSHTVGDQDHRVYRGLQRIARADGWIETYRNPLGTFVFYDKGDLQISIHTDTGRDITTTLEWTE